MHTGLYDFVECYNNKVVSEGRMRSGKKLIETRYTYYDDGKLKEEGKYKKGKLDGVCKYYNEGQLIA